MKINKYIILPCLLSVLLLLVPSCQEKEPTETATPPTDVPSQEQIQQLYTDAIAASLNAETYKFEMNIAYDMEATGGTEPGKVNMVMNATGAYDQINKNMHMSMDMNMDAPEIEEGMQNMSMEMYMYEENMYMKMDMPMVGEQWIKMPVSAEMAAAYNSNMVGDQLELLEGAGEIEFLRYEVVDGSDCYVFKLIPDMQKIMEWVGQQQMGGEEFDFESIKNISDVFKDLAYIIWIARDSGYMKKMDASITMEATAEQFGAKDGEFDGMKMDMSMAIRMYDYDKPVTIVLPEEALNAAEMPVSHFE